MRDESTGSLADASTRSTERRAAVSAPETRQVRPTGPSQAQWVALAAGFAAVHLTLSIINLYDTVHYPFGDVTGVYRFWMDYARDNGVLVGVDTTFVYPIGALVPIALPYLAGSAFYGQAWLLMVTVLNAVAVVMLARRRPSLAWWWIAFLACLGPVAVARIDSIAAPLAIAAVLVVERRPVVAGALLAAGAWIKVWPAALVIAAVVALRARARIVLGAALTTAVVIAAALAAGAGGGIFSFVFEQTGRGLQVEAPVSIWWLASAALGSGARVYYDTGILTYQVAGAGTQVVAALMTPILAIVVLGILLLAVVAMRRGADAMGVFADTAFAVVLAFIVLNKVGSPQFIGWLAAPVLLLLLIRGRRERVTAAVVLAVAVVTQIVYPWFYGALVGAEEWAVLLILARHIVLLALLAVAVSRLIVAGRQGEDLLARSLTQGV